ncbi:12106_t:CDS:1, partial [Funneliformis geosporum]
EEYRFGRTKITKSEEARYIQEARYYLIKVPIQLISYPISDIL